MDTPDPKDEDQPIDPELTGADDQEPEGPRFPVIVLAAPGFILTLFAAMADALVESFGSVRLAILVGVVAGLGAVACFGIIGAKSTERHIHIGVAIAIGATIFALCAAILRLS